MSDEKLSLGEWAREMAKKRAAALTPKRRKQIAKKAAQKRWEKKVPPKK